MNTVGTLTIEMMANIVRLQQDMDKAKKTVDNAMGDIKKSVEVATAAIASIVGALSVEAFATKLIAVQREFDVLNSSLITVSGSSRAAEIEFAWIKDFAATTPFSLAEVTGAFVKMKALGLDASREALESYGNTASAMGKSLNQLIEAVADAATGEFERLKEFGIKASSEGDRVTLTFRGMSETVGKNAAEITEYLRRLGEVDFAGAMETRAKTLDGAISNLGDTWDQLFMTFNKGLFGDILLDSVRGLTSVIQGLNNGVASLGTAIENNKTQLMIWAGIFTGGALLAALPAIVAAVGALTAGVVALSAAFAANPVALAIMALTAAAVPAVNAISAMVAENKRAEEATKAVYESEQQRAAFMEANASPAQEKAIALTKEQVKELEKQESLYTKLVEKLRETNAELLLEEANNGKLSSTQKEALKVMLDIQTGALKLTEARKLEIVTLLEGNIALEQEAARRGEVKKQLEEQAKAYEKVVGSINEQAAKLIEADGALSGMSDAQRDANDFLKKYIDEISKLSDDQKARVGVMLEELIAQKELNNAMTNGAAAAERYQDARDKLLTEQIKSLVSIDKEVEKQKELNAGLSLSKQEVGMLEVAKINERAASLERAAQLALEADFDAETAENYRIQAERLRELANLKEKGVHVQAAKDAADEWKKATDELSKGLTDALMRGFESGKGFFENLLDVMRNRFKAFVAESIIKPFMDGVAAGLLGITNPISNAIKGMVSSLLGTQAATSAVAGGAVTSGAAIAGGAATAGTTLAGIGTSIAGGVSSIAGGIGSAMSSVATALGPIGLAIGAAALIAKLAGGGETRVGGRYLFGPNGVEYVGGPSGGQIEGATVQSEISGLAGGINEALAAAGSATRVAELYAGLESSKNGKGGTFVGGKLTDGQLFGDVVPNNNPNEWNFSESLSAAQAVEQFSRELQFASTDAVNVALGLTRGTSPGARSVGGAAGGGDTGRIVGVQSFATGTNFIPQDMLAYLHKGEAVVPAQYNPVVGGENVVAAEIRALRDEVTLMRAETRSTAINTSKIFRLQDNWDVRGLTVKTDVDQPLDTVVV
jgi:hypothetical protein